MNTYMIKLCRIKFTYTQDKWREVKFKESECYWWILSVISQHPGWDIFTTQDVSPVGGYKMNTWGLCILFLMTASKSEITLIKILIQNITLRHYFSPTY